MRSNWHKPSDSDVRDARLTAYALGQLNENERAVVESELAGSQYSDRQVQETSLLALALSEAEVNAPRFQPSAGLRDAIEQRLDDKEAKSMKNRREANQSSSTFENLLPWAVAASLLVALGPLAWKQLQSPGGLFATHFGQVADNSTPTLPPTAGPWPHGTQGAQNVITGQAPHDPYPYTDATAAVVPSEPMEESVPWRTPEVVPGPGVGLSPTEVKPDEVPQAIAEVAPGQQESLEHSFAPGSTQAVPTQPAPHEGKGVPTADLVLSQADPGSEDPMAVDNPGTRAPVPGVATQTVAPTSPSNSNSPSRSTPLTEALASSVPPPVYTPYSAMPGDGQRMVPMSNHAMTDRYRMVHRGNFPATTGSDITASPTAASYPANYPLHTDLPTTYMPAPTPPQYHGPPPVNYSGENYANITENEFRSPSDRRHAKSTFSVDVDTASYANVRRFLNNRTAPPVNAVRVEELINYFDYDYPQPVGDDPFSVNLEVADCPWNSNHNLVRIGVKGREIPRAKRPPCNLVFLIDVSGSMRDPDKLPLLQRALSMLVAQLNEDDRVSIVTYAGEAALKLASVSGDQHDRIREAIDTLSAGGGTNGSAGIEIAYNQAAESIVEDGANRVILATDGDLNLGITDDNALLKLIRKKAADDIFLTVLGFGSGNLQDAKMEHLADNGNGVYGYIDGLTEARRVLVDQISGSLVTIAKDVKIQVEFNPSQVARYRLIGYENRTMANQDFANDKKDAGEIGAGHTVTALYEIEPVGSKDGDDAGDDGDLKYQRLSITRKIKATLTGAGNSDELLTMHLRYKQPTGRSSIRKEYVLKNEVQDFDDASTDFCFASAVASFGMLLRNSSHRGTASWSSVQEIASDALGEDARGFRTEFLELVRLAESAAVYRTYPAYPTSSQPPVRHPHPIVPAPERHPMLP